MSISLLQPLPVPVPTVAGGVSAPQQSPFARGEGVCLQGGAGGLRVAVCRAGGARHPSVRRRGGEEERVVGAARDGRGMVRHALEAGGRRGSNSWRRRRRRVRPNSSGTAVGCLRWRRHVVDLPMALALERRCMGPIWVLGLIWVPWARSGFQGPGAVQGCLPGGPDDLASGSVFWWWSAVVPVWLEVGLSVFPLRAGSWRSVGLWM
jgi:hypothetical protein